MANHARELYYFDVNTMENNMMQGRWPLHDTEDNVDGGGQTISTRQIRS
jgi:hypothetical protein